MFKVGERVRVIVHPNVFPLVAGTLGTITKVMSHPRLREVRLDGYEGYLNADDAHIFATVELQRLSGLERAIIKANEHTP